MKIIISLLVFLAVSQSLSADVILQWIHALNSRHASLEEKARACQRLGEFGGEKAVPALAAQLNDPVLNAYARAGLERIPGTKSGEALHAALGEVEGTPLIGVIESLGNLEVSASIEDLSKLIGHSEEEVSDASLRALGKMGKRAVPIVLSYLKNSSAKVRASAATASLLAAERLNDAGLYDAVLTADVPKQIHLAAVRGAILSKSSFPYLLQQLRSNDSEVQDIAFLALRSFPKAGLAEVLHSELRSNGGANPIRLVYALRDLPNRDTIGVLVDQLEDATGDYKSAIIQSLGNLGGVESAKALLPLVNNDDAFLALAGMDGDNIDSLIVRDLKNATNEKRRIQLITLLGDRRSHEAVNVLLEQAKASESTIQKAALRAMRPMVGLPQLPSLIDLFNKADEKSRDQVLSTLVSASRQSHPLEAAGDLLLTELKTATGDENRQPWIRVLVAMGYTPALPIIMEGLHSKDPETVTTIIHLLGRWPDATPTDSLFEMTTHPDYQKAALRAILSLIATSKDAAARLEWLKRAQPMVSSRSEKQQFVSLLSGTFDPGSLELLDSYKHDQEIAEEAQAARDRLKRVMRL